MIHGRIPISTNRPIHKQTKRPKRVSLGSCMYVCLFWVYLRIFPGLFLIFFWAFQCRFWPIARCALYCTVLQRMAEYCRGLQRIAGDCSVLQCIAVCECVRPGVRVSVHICMCVCIFPFMYICLYICMYVCMYVCVHTMENMPLTPPSPMTHTLGISK